ncbi:spore coat protein YlbD [Sporolactobacillus kofuensis]|uniref:Spore coat protein YlbD n=2 Tax=Sporolactobacillus kofuensis TaxID=269672 RepID=A0ABW1WE70_9BACL
MGEERTNAAIKRFKVFLRNHPQIVTYVHEHDVKWNDVFDDWVIFGESHEVWEKYGVKNEQDDPSKSESQKKSSFSINKVLKVVDNIDTKQWQERLDTISGALSGIQTFIGQFRQSDADPGQKSTITPNEASERSTSSMPEQQRNQRPFYFRRD